MRTVSVRLAWVCAFALLVVGCGDRDDVMGPDPTPSDDVLAPVPGGIPLPGDPATRAWEAVVSLAPSPAPATEIQGTLLTTRLRAILAPGATVQEVNEALAASDAAIVSMTRGVPIVVLVIDPVADLAEAEARAAELAASEAFLAVFPARTFGSSDGTGRSFPARVSRPGLAARVHGPGQMRDLPEGSDEAGPDPHIAHLRMPAAWNARALDTAPVTVLLADHFPDRDDHPGVDPLEFSFYGGFGTDAYGRNGNILGNEGTFSAGVIGGNWDTDLPGVHPGPGLRIVGIPLSGLDLWEVSSAIYDELAYGVSRGRDRTVLLTGLTYEEAEADDLTPLELASLALGWRLTVRGQIRDFEPQMLHVVPGGDQSPFDDSVPLGTDTSYWSVAAAYGDLRTYLLSLDPTEEEVTAFDRLIAETGASSRLPLDNVLIVGASTSDGSPLPTGASLTDVRVHGDLVWGPCELEETTAPGIECDGTAAAYTGTFAAAPQVAGLAAYLWSLAPARTSGELHALIEESFRESYRDGFLDAYRAVLGLDPNLLDPRVRETLLDPNDDGRFDETDIAAFLAAFESHATEREQGNIDPDYSRFDLNGDGFTGGTATLALDLDADRMLQTVTAEGLDSSFDESTLSDLEILCYYAHSDLYFGDPDRLAEVLPGCEAELTIEARGLENGVTADGATLRVTVRASADGNAEVEGARLTFSVDGGTADPASAVTDDEGYATTTIRPSAGTAEVAVTIEAEDDAGRSGTETVRAPNLDNLPIRVRLGGRAWLNAFSADSDNVDHRLYTESTPEANSWQVNWNRRVDGDQNGTTCSSIAIVQAESALLFDDATRLFRAASFNATIEASGEQATGDPGNSIFCRGEGQIQMTFWVTINEGTWRFATEGSVTVEEVGDTNWNPTFFYRDLERQGTSWPEITDLTGEFVLGPGEYSIFFNPRGVGNTDVLGSAGFEGSISVDFQMTTTRQ